MNIKDEPCKIITMNFFPSNSVRQATIALSKTWLQKQETRQRKAMGEKSMPPPMASITPLILLEVSTRNPPPVRTMLEGTLLRDLNQRWNDIWETSCPGMVRHPFLRLVNPIHCPKPLYHPLANPTPMSNLKSLPSPSLRSWCSSTWWNKGYRKA